MEQVLLLIHPKSGGGHCVLKWGFMRTFPGNQDGTLKYKILLVFEIPYQPRVKEMPGKI